MESRGLVGSSLYQVFSFRASSAGCVAVVSRVVEVGVSGEEGSVEVSASASGSSDDSPMGLLMVREVVFGAPVAKSTRSGSTENISPGLSIYDGCFIYS